MLKGLTKTEYQCEYMRKKRATPAIIRALVDPQKRAILEYISQDLNRKHLGDLVRYGIYGPTFEVIAELLEVTA